MQACHSHATDTVLTATQSKAPAIHPADWEHRRKWENKVPEIAHISGFLLTGKMH